MTRTSKCLLAAATTALLFAAACTSDGSDSAQGGTPVSSSSSEEAFAELMKRPSIDEAVQQYQQLDTQIMQELSKTIPGLGRWEQVDDGSDSGCGADEPGIAFDGRTHSLPLYGVRQNVPDTHWSEAVSTVGRLAAKYGFDPKAQVLHDIPRNHEVAFHNVNDDSRILFGTAQNTSLSLKIGCHLTTESKRRGHLSP